MARKSAELCSSQCQIFWESIGIAPHAEISDGEFAITNVGDISLLDYFKNIGTAKNAKKSIIHKFLILRLRKFSSKMQMVWLLTIDMDGEFIGYAPVKFTCLKENCVFEVKIILLPFFVHHQDWENFPRFECLVFDVMNNFEQNFRF